MMQQCNLFFAGVKINVLINAIVLYCVQLRFSKNLSMFHVDMDHLERKVSSSREKMIVMMCTIKSFFNEAWCVLYPSINFFLPPPPKILSVRFICEGGFYSGQYGICSSSTSMYL
ncbi:hypothetical protein C0J52_07074 [Blattella germanica]|nr:hypothetical protein C0J52_07074 [Blattella germanica]